MRKNLLVSVLLVVALFLFNLCCEKKTITSRRPDFDEIRAIIYENPDIFLVDVFDTYKDTSVKPIFFREITSRDFDLDRAVRNDAKPPLYPFPRIDAVWGDIMKGVLHYCIDGREYTKQIHAHSFMHAYFEQWGDAYDPYRGWLLKKISGNVIVSMDTSSRAFEKLHITSSTVDTVLYEYSVLNPTKFSRWSPDKDTILRFGMGEEVTFTVQSRDTTDYLFLHVGEDGNFRKIPFLSNGDGTFSCSWTTTSDPGIAKGYKHAFVDAVSRDALTDTTTEYDSKAWGIIYRIK
jgi:hypothetical protein